MSSTTQRRSLCSQNRRPTNGSWDQLSRRLTSLFVRFAGVHGGDAQQIRFDDAVSDRTLSPLVVNFIPDVREAIGEMKRVTKPKGTVAAAVWDYGEGMEMLRTFWDEAVALAPASASKDERNMPVCRASSRRSGARTARGTSSKRG